MNKMKSKEKLICLSDTNAVLRKIKLCYWRLKNFPDQCRVEKMVKKRKDGYYDERFAKIKNLEMKHNGARCFIVATGPSLTMEDLHLLKNEVSFGMNSIIKIFDRTDWRPTYYGIQDRHVYKKMEDSILKCYHDAQNVLVADQLKLFFDIPDNFIQFPFNGNYHIYRGDYDDYSAEFSPNSYEVVYDGYSITYSLIEIAIYMGFKQIYLLGVDCNYPKGESNHIVKSGFIDKNAASNPIRMRVGYKKAKEYADGHGIKIINCTRGGMLEVFPRKRLEDVLEEKE